MNWAERQKAKGIRLELTPHVARNCWKKKHSGGTHKYFLHPITAAGYEAALGEWFQFKRQLEGTKPHTETVEHHQRLFAQVQQWYDAFGVPVSEAKLADQVSAFLPWLAECLKGDLSTPYQLPIGGFTTSTKRTEFSNEFVDPEGTGYTSIGSHIYELPAKWIDRIDRATATVLDKEPQTIGYWFDKYLTKVETRVGKFIVAKTSQDRKYKLVHFSKYCDKLAHITTIDSDYLEAYHTALDDAPFDKSSKEGYFKAFRMFVRKSAQAKGCDLQPPANLESRDFKFREPKGTGRKRQAKKQLLWTVEEFTNAIKTLPQPYSCYLMMMMNCGFRHVDIANLRHVDVDLKAARITIQRNKLNQQDTAPVVSYPLWKKTIELLRKAKSSDKEFVFRNMRGGDVENAIKCWWKDHHEDYAKGKRLDFIRKTGSTIVARHDPNLDEMYLGESLKTTTKVFYSFNDGEPCQALDDAIGVLGSLFGFCEAPVKRVTLTAEMLAKLKKAGIDISTLDR
jgi:integrase